MNTRHLHKNLDLARELVYFLCISTFPHGAKNEEILSRFETVNHSQLTPFPFDSLEALIEHFRQIVSLASERVPLHRNGKSRHVIQLKTSLQREELLAVAKACLALLTADGNTHG
jgi:hypothetical protein